MNKDEELKNNIKSMLNDIKDNTTNDKSFDELKNVLNSIDNVINEIDGSINEINEKIKINLIEEIESSSLLTTREFKDGKYDLLYVDFSEKNKTFEVFTKKVTLNNKLINFDFDKIVKLVEEKIDTTLNNNHTFDFTFNDENNEDNLIQKINILSSLIAVDGRVGGANTIITNEYYYNILKDKEDINFIIDNDLTNKIYIYRNNSSDQPGIVLCYNDSSFNIVSIGFFPDKQVGVVNII